MSNRIKEFRKSRGWSMEKLAKRINTTAPTIDKLEKGETKLVSHWLENLAEVFDVSPDVLIWGSDDLVPMVSWVQAGVFADTSDPYIPESTPKIEVGGLPHGNFIALTVDGDSMNLIAPDGAVIVVDYTDRELRPGKDYVFRMNDQATLKRWRDNPKRLEPYSSNPEHETIFPQDQVEVVGRVVKVIIDL